jgi:hypothetical protein
MNQGGKWSEAVRATRALLLMLNEHDQAGLFCFNDALFDKNMSERLKIAPVSRSHLLDSWDAVRATGLGEGSPMVGTMDRGLDALSKVSGRRAMIVLTDGMDTDAEGLDSRKQGVIAKAQELKVPLYMVSTSSGDADVKIMQEMASGSPGGEFHLAADPRKIKDIFETIGKSLQNEYTLNYTSPNPVEDGLKRRVTVNVRSGLVGKQAYGDYNVPGVISTGAASQRSAGGSFIGRVVSIGTVFAVLTVLLGLMLGAPLVLRSAPAAEQEPEAAPVAQAVPAAVPVAKPALTPAQAAQHLSASLPKAPRPQGKAPGTHPGIVPIPGKLPRSHQGAPQAKLPPSHPGRRPSGPEQQQ